MSLDLLSRVFEETRIGEPAEKLLLLYLADQATPDGDLVFNAAKAASKCCLSAPDLSVRLVELEARGILRSNPKHLDWMKKRDSFCNRGLSFYWLNVDAIGAGEELQLPLHLCLEDGENL